MACRSVNRTITTLAAYSLKFQQRLANNMRKKNQLECRAHKNYIDVFLEVPPLQLFLS